MNPRRSRNPEPSFKSAVSDNSCRYSPIERAARSWKVMHSLVHYTSKPVLNNAQFVSPIWNILHVALVSYRTTSVDWHSTWFRNLWMGSHGTREWKTKLVARLPGISLLQKLKWIVWGNMMGFKTSWTRVGTWSNFPRLHHRLQYSQKTNSHWSVVDQPKQVISWPPVQCPKSCCSSWEIHVLHWRCG